MAFVVALSQALGWPITVLAIFFVIRKQLVALIPAVRELKYKDVQVTFGERVRELATEAAEELPAPAASRGMTADERLRLDRIAQLSPRSAVLEAWIPVEQAAVDLAAERGLEFDRQNYPSPRALISALLRAGAISEEEASIFNALRSLRNEAAHALDFLAPRDAVTEFIDLSERLANALQARRPAE